MLRIFHLTITPWAFGSFLFSSSLHHLSNSTKASVVLFSIRMGRTRTGSTSMGSTSTVCHRKSSADYALVWAMRYFK